MSVQEVERAISSFTHEEFSELKKWLTEYQLSRPRKSLTEIAGTISPEDLKIMADEIEAGCETIDLREW